MKTLLKIFLVSVAVSWPQLLYAASITQVKDRKAILDISDLLDSKVGDRFLSVDDTGKAKSLLEIRQIKGSRALAEVIKGVPAAGQSLRLASPAPISRPVNQSDIGDIDPRLERLRQRAEGPAWGFLGHFNQTKMDVTFTAGATGSEYQSSSNMTGSTFGVSGFYDYEISPRFQIRGIAGLDQISAKGSCDKGTPRTSQSCNFEVTYLTLAAQAKYFLNEGTTKYWVGGGGSFLLAMSKASNVLATSQISTNQVYFISGGADIGLSGKSFVPVSFEYGLFPPSDTVKTNIMVLRAGYGWYF